jgi:hypothetical protein
MKLGDDSSRNYTRLPACFGRQVDSGERAMTLVSERRFATEEIVIVPRVVTLRLECWRSFLTAILYPYRPELHYMRGPGPKWQAKHAEKLRD